MKLSKINTAIIIFYTKIKYNKSFLELYFFIVTNETFVINLEEITDLSFRQKVMTIEKDMEFRENQIQTNRSDHYQAFVWTPVIGQKRYPPKRGGHSMNLFGDKLIIFAGCFLDLECYNDIWFFDIH